MRPPALRHRGAPREHLVYVRLQWITKHDTVAPDGAAEEALLCLGRAGFFGGSLRRCERRWNPRDERGPPSWRSWRNSEKGSPRKRLGKHPRQQHKRLSTGGSNRPCSNYGCRYNRRSKTTASTPVCPYSCRKTACEFRSSSMGKSCTCGRVDSKLS